MNFYVRCQQTIAVEDEQVLQYTIDHTSILYEIFE